MKRFFCGLLAALTLAALLAAPAFAADDSRRFDFALSVDGSTEKRAAAGDIITVTFTLRRTDASEDYTMYAMQDEILYDSAFFELVPDSAVTADRIQTADIALRGGERAFYMNFVSLSGGETWKADTVVGTFQLKVTGTAGSSVIRSSENRVSTSDGSDSFTAAAQDVTVIVTDDCLIRFESNGGSAVPDQTAARGSRLRRPDDPVKDGYHLEGWYRDADLQNKWDFDKDTVTGNMTLYAGWVEGTAAAAFSLWWLLLLILLLIVAILVLLGRKNARRRVRRPDEPERGNAGERETEKEDRDE